ncbi:hypothetical protein P8452_56674 [Trifolium repens]|nr:hypothetical protein P8452_56674 [Trifolium repens]
MGITNHGVTLRTTQRWLKTKLLTTKFFNNFIVLKNKSDGSLDRIERMKLVLSSEQNKSKTRVRDVVKMYLQQGFEARQKR